MNLSDITTTEIVILITVALAAVFGIAAWVSLRRQRTEKLRAQFGGAEYSRAVVDGGSVRKAETALAERQERVAGLHIRELAAADRARFLASWARVQARFVDSPGGAITEADQLLGDVMSLRGYPVSDFERRAADISVDHPIVLANYRAGHESALRQMRGQASTEELRQAMIHYRTLFEELVGQPEVARSMAN